MVGLQNDVEEISKDQVERNDNTIRVGVSNESGSGRQPTESHHEGAEW